MGLRNFQGGAQGLRLRRATFASSAGVVIAAVTVLCGRAAFAQEALQFVRRSTLPAPAVSEVEVLRQRRVEIPSPRALSDAMQSRVLELDLFPDVLFRAVRERLEPTAHGVSWVGVLDGYPESTALLVLVGDEVIGHVYAPFGFFRIERQPDGGYLVQQVDQDTFTEGDDAVEPPPEEAPGDGVPSGIGDDGSVIDLLVVYTRDALDGFGSEARALATVDLIVAQTNEALRNTGLPTRVRLVHVTSVEYAETGDSSLDLSRLRTPGDGFLDDVLPLRDLYAADLVALITELITEPNVCGRGDLGSSAGNERFGFSITARRCTANGRTFPHELGHNLGAHHDWYETASPGAHPYSKGHVSLAGQFLDVMAYFNLCRDTRTACTRLLAYSNPSLAHNGHRQGVAVGTNVTCTAGDVNNPPCDADVARTFGKTAAVVARYRNSRTSLAARQILPGRSLRSDSGQYRLAYQTDGNLVLYDDGAQAALWATNTAGTSPGQAILQTDGNFVVYDGGGVARWSSGTAGNPNAYFLVQNDGNVVVYRSNGQPIWDRHHGPLVAAFQVSRGEGLHVAEK